MLLRDLAKLPPAKKKAEIDRMVASSKKAPNGQLDPIRLEIRALEDKHGMSTEDMLAKFRRGQLDNEFDFVQWKMLSRLVRG